MKKTQSHTPVESYRIAATELQRARDAYDHKAGNAAFARMMRAARAIRTTESDGGREFFTSLLDSEMPHVVKAAAFNLIPLSPELARRALQELAKGPPGEVRFDAEMTLEEWSSGRLDPNWFLKD